MTQSTLRPQPDIHPILLNVLRQTIPQLIASDLLKVQPMPDHLGEAFKFGPGTKEPYVVWQTMEGWFFYKYAAPQSVTRLLLLEVGPYDSQDEAQSDCDILKGLHGCP